MAVSRLQESSILLKVALGIAAIATLLQIIGVSTNYWVYVNVGGIVTAHQGLWKVCGSLYGVGACANYDTDAFGTSEWMTPVKVLSIVGLVGMGTATLFLFISVCATANKTLRGFTVAIASLSACCILAGVVVFGVKAVSTEHLHYSFALCAAAGGLSIICSIFLCVDVGQRQPVSRSQPARVYSPGAPTVAYQAHPGYAHPAYGHQGYAHPGYAPAHTVQVVQYPPGGHYKY